MGWVKFSIFKFWGDVVLAVNGVSVTSYSHSSLVNLISSLLTMRLVTIFRVSTVMGQKSFLKTRELRYVRNERIEKMKIGKT